MLVKILVTLLFSSSLTLSFGSTKSTTAFTSIQKTISGSKAEPTPTELRIGRNFKKVFKLTQKGLINKHLILKLNKDLQKSITLYKYKVWPKNILEIHNASSIPKLKRRCDQIADKSYTDKVIAYLNENTLNICLNKYLKILSQKKNYSLKFHKKQVSFLKEYYPHLLNRFNHDELEYLLSRFEKRSAVHNLYSQSITKYLIGYQVTPRKSLLRYLAITPKLTRFIQARDLEWARTNSVFYSEFRKLTKASLAAADNEEAPASKKEMNQRTDEIINYYKSTLVHQPKQKVVKSLLSYGKSLVRRNHPELARKCFTQILSHDKKYFEDTVFELMWTYINLHDYDEAISEVVEKYIPNIEKVKHNSKLYFWIGKNYLKAGEKDKAQVVFRQLIKRNPLSFYAILSAKILSDNDDDGTNDTYWTAVGNPRKLEFTRKPAGNPVDYRWLKRVTLWGKTNNQKFLSLELKNIHLEKSDDELELNLLAAAYKLSKNEDYLDSFKVIYKSVDKGDIRLSEDSLRILFPVPYYAQIKNKISSIDPVIPLSLIRQESGFNRHAKSIVGARGLMQLMPTTARQFKRRLKTRHLYNPKLNIRIGTKYLGNLFKRYNKNLVYTLAAYNAGENRVDRWQADYLNSDSILHNIENIPFLETRKYVKLIFRNIFFYKMLAGNSQMDSEKLNKIYDIHLGFNQ